MSEQELKCPKCGNDKLLYWDNYNGTLYEDDINTGKERAKNHPEWCHKVKVDGYGNYWWYSDYKSEWYKEKYQAKDYACFCKCGYYSKNYKDFQ